MDSWFETFCQELLIRRAQSGSGQGLVLAREDFGLVLHADGDWSAVPVRALVQGLAPRWVAMFRTAVMPLVEQDPATGLPWEAGEAVGYRARDDAREGVVADVLVIDLLDAARGSGQWVLGYEINDRGVSFAEAIRVGECAEEILALSGLEPRDPGRIPTPDGTGRLSRAQGRLTLDLGGAHLGVRRLVESGGHGFAYASEAYAPTLTESGIAPVELVTLDI
ncbi:hypothetical protein GA0111570_10360 [Raineyella antarctica]|uniref:Uncharacterized protein n=1 Tax=Raineyella antarctica TaxID=1577474 RepID=A0A1G6GFG2_9ACTN|nr:hypothetical protein [Raineyella antarctica]SDB80741.1 hypothetical protein GA0111570_10360 [Raineyella antarctica]